MSIRHTRVLLCTAAGLLTVGTAALGWWAMEPPTWPKTARIESDGRRPPPGTGSESPPRPLDDYAPLWARRLRGPLVDPPPRVAQPMPQPKPKKAPVTAPPPRPQPPPAVQLVGTIIEDGRSVALVADQTGKIDLCGEGEALDLTPAGIRVERISAEVVSVSFEGHQFTLELQRGGARTKSQTNNRRRAR